VLGLLQLGVSDAQRIETLLRPRPSARPSFLPARKPRQSPRPARRKPPRLPASTHPSKQIPTRRRRSRGCPGPAIHFARASPPAHFLSSGRAAACASRARRRTSRRAAAPPPANVRNNPTSCSPKRRGAEFPRPFEFTNVSRSLAGSGAFLPRSKILLLFGCQFVQVMSQRVQLQLGDFPVQVLRHNIHLRFHFFVVLHQVFRGKRLIRETHIHHGSGMPFGRGQIHQASFGNEVNLAAVLHQEFIHQRSNFPLASG